MKFYGNYLKNFILLLSISNFASAISIVDVMEFFPKSIADVSVPQTNIFDYNPDVDLPAVSF